MKKRIFAALLMMLLVVSCTYSCFAVNEATAEESVLFIKQTTYADDTLTVTIGNNSGEKIFNAALVIAEYDENAIQFPNLAPFAQTGEIAPGGEVVLTYPATIPGYEPGDAFPVISGEIQYIVASGVVDSTISSTAIAPTLCHIMGIEAPWATESQPLKEVTTKKTGKN